VLRALLCGKEKETKVSYFLSAENMTVIVSFFLPLFFLIGSFKVLYFKFSNFLQEQINFI